MILPTAAAMTTRRSSFSEILGAGISPPPFLGVSRESLREPSKCPPRLQNFDPAKLQAAPAMSTTVQRRVRGTRKHVIPNLLVYGELAFLFPFLSSCS